jgi:hypothetical protein
MALLEKAKALLREARLQAYPILLSESAKYNVTIPPIIGVKEIKIKGIRRWAVYEFEWQRILINLAKIHECLLMGWSDKTIKQSLLEAIFHEFKHHIDHVKYGIGPEEYLKAPEYYEKQAEEYAIKILTTRLG